MATPSKPVETGAAPVAEVDPVLEAARAEIAELKSAAEAAATADNALVDALVPWLGAMHVGINARAGHDVLTWMTARGFETGPATPAVSHGMNVVGESIPEAAFSDVE